MLRFGLNWSLILFTFSVLEFDDFKEKWKPKATGEALPGRTGRGRGRERTPSRLHTGLDLTTLRSDLSRNQELDTQPTEPPRYSSSSSYQDTSPMGLGLPPYDLIEPLLPL